MKKLSFLLICLLAVTPLAAQNSGVKSFRIVREVPFTDYAKRSVEQQINQWQKRGDFEKIADWQKRVNETTRNAKIAELTRQAEQNYIAEQSANASLSCTLSDYDTENEVFMLRDAVFGNLLVPVPITEAPAFKQNWYNCKTNSNYCVANNKLALTSVDFTFPNGKKYRYSNTASLTFADIKDICQFDDIEIDAPTTTPRGNQTIAQTTISIGKSDVDIDIPQTTTVNDKTFAVIISNENYKQLAQVPFALNDGKMFAEYCHKTLGLPGHNIRSYSNATYGDMLEAVRDIRNISNTFNGEAKVLFYYAGHGAPNEDGNEAYLIPVDAYRAQKENCYALNLLYKELGALKAQSVTVFLDACFSGAGRDEKMLASTRGVKIRAVQGVPEGNMVVFSAATDDETALPYAEKGHGLFTYFLLKKLQESKGDVTYGDLGDYISTHVRRQSNVVNRKEQTPTAVPAASLAESWQSMKLK